jgi:hypothetical protein
MRCDAGCVPRLFACESDERTIDLDDLDLTVFRSLGKASLVRSEIRIVDHKMSKSLVVTGD